MCMGREHVGTERPFHVSLQILFRSLALDYKLNLAPSSWLMRIPYLIFILILLTPAIFAQTTTLRGQVTDESGALVPGATVTLLSPDGTAKTAVADGQGHYSFTP